MYKLSFIVTVFLILPCLASGQDTIFLKKGTILAADIQDTSRKEIRYKKPGQPEPAGIYTVFKSDVLKIRYRNGKEYIYYRKPEDLAGNVAPTIKPVFSFGAAYHYFNRNNNDNLDIFWRYINANENLNVSTLHGYYSFNIGMGFYMGINNRSFLHSGMQVALMKPGTLFAKNYAWGNNEVKLGSVSMNILVEYGRSLNHSRTIYAIFEPALNIGFMTGKLVLRDEDYKLSGTSGMAGHFATGINYIPSKWITLSARIGYKFMKIENQYYNPTAQRYLYLIANPNLSDELMYVNYGGLFVNVGLRFTIEGSQKL